jgi:histidinol dehydrogenase
MIEIITRDNRDARQAALKRVRERDIARDIELILTVREIIEEVRRHGDAALIDYAARFDGIHLTRERLRVSETDLKSYASGVNPEVVAAIREAILRVRAFHERQKEHSWKLEGLRPGVHLGQRITPIMRAGLYVPGGSAAYPSSVVMNVVPAQIAGVERLVVTTPPRALSGNPALAATLLELGVTEIYAVGGAQAIAALAYGTETVPRVDKITGPGNRFVAAAKREVFGTVGIDSIAGPSEVVIIADQTARPDFIAADMLAQAEHSEDASAILITDTEQIAQGVVVELERQLKSLPRKEIAVNSLGHYGAVFLVENMREACDIANELAPEHVEIMADGDEELATWIKHAGAIFLGSYTPEAVGDYFAGPNHVLPTGGAVRYASALGVYDFVRRTSVLRYSAKELNETAPMIATLASAEGLDAHARSALIRLENSSRNGESLQ